MGALNDSILLAGSEAMQAALAYYQSVKQAAKLNVPVAKVIAGDLSSRFEGQGRKSTTTTVETPFTSNLAIHHHALGVSKTYAEGIFISPEGIPDTPEHIKEGLVVSGDKLVRPLFKPLSKNDEML